jgi:hypothetical protein
LKIEILIERNGTKNKSLNTKLNTIFKVKKILVNRQHYKGTGEEREKKTHCSGSGGEKTGIA